MRLLFSSLTSRFVRQAMFFESSRFACLATLLRKTINCRVERVSNFTSREDLCCQLVPSLSIEEEMPYRLCSSEVKTIALNLNEDVVLLFVVFLDERTTTIDSTRFLQPSKEFLRQPFVDEMPLVRLGCATVRISVNESFFSRWHRAIFSPLNKTKTFAEYREQTDPMQRHSNRPTVWDESGALLTKQPLLFLFLNGFSRKFCENGLLAESWRRKTVDCQVIDARERTLTW